MDRKKALETLDMLYGIRERDVKSVLDALGKEALSDEALERIAQGQLQEELSLKTERERARDLPGISYARIVSSQTESTVYGEIVVYSVEETPPPGRRFAPNTPGVEDGGQKYRAATTNPRFADICNRLGPHEETSNGFLAPHGWAVHRGYYSTEIKREFFPEEFPSAPEGSKNRPTRESAQKTVRPERESFRDDGRGR